MGEERARCGPGDAAGTAAGKSWARPPRGARVHRVDRDGIRVVTVAGDPPTVTVENPQGAEDADGVAFYWIGPPATLTVGNPDAEPGDFRLTLRCIAGPGNPDPHRVVALGPAEGGGPPLEREVTGDGRVTFPLHLPPGRTRLRIAVARPGEWTVHLPADPRRLMLRIQDLDLVRVDSP